MAATANSQTATGRDLEADAEPSGAVDATPAIRPII